MFLLLRVVRPLVKLIVLAALAVVALVAWGNFWPAPGHRPDVPCPRHDGFRCVRVSGRVLLSTSFGHGRRPHVILMSRSSVTLPGLTSLEMPALDHKPGGLGLGDWVVATGQRTKGSHGEADVHVWDFSSGAQTIACADPGVGAYCHRRRR